VKKTILIIISITIYANVGFWSTALGTAAGEGGSKNYYYGKDASQETKKIQQTLSKLGFYNGSFDGNLNSFDTRSAIEEFQNYYSLEDSGILNSIQKADLLYMHDLLKSYKLELQDPKSEDSKRLIKIYKAFDKLENKLNNKKFHKEYLSIKFNHEIIERRNSINKRASLEKTSGTLTIDGLMWKRCVEGKKWDGNTCTGEAHSWRLGKADTHASKMEYSGYDDWRIPTIDELYSLVYCSSKKTREIVYKKKTNSGIKTINGVEQNGQCLGTVSNIPTINKNNFPNFTKEKVWSRTKAGSVFMDPLFLRIDFSNAAIDSYVYKYGNNILLVRSVKN